jgi:ATP-binding cassette subfamily B protein
LLAPNGLYASMWTRQREAEEARAKLARAGGAEPAPNRNPPAVEDAISQAAAARGRDITPADAAE